MTEPTRLQRMWRLILDCQYHGRDVTYAFDTLSAVQMPDVSIDAAVRACHATGRPLRPTIAAMAVELQGRDRRH